MLFNRNNWDYNSANNLKIDTNGKIIIPIKYDTIKIKGANVIVTRNGKTESIKI